MTIGRVTMAFVLGFALVATRANASEADVAKFYSRTPVTLDVGFSAGGNYDIYARLVSKYLGRHIPGNPNVIVQNVPGAGSRVLANQLYNNQPQDGATLGLIDQGIPIDEALGGPGIAFDASKFQWLGSPNSEVSVVWTAGATSVKTLQDAQSAVASLGSSGPGSTTYFFPRVMNLLLGTKFKIVNGYPGTNEIIAAIEQGELDGAGATTWSALKTSADFVSSHKVNVLVQIGAKKAPDLPNVPLLSDLAKNDRDRKALEFVSSAPAMGRPFIMPPHAPQERVDAIRNALEATKSVEMAVRRPPKLNREGWHGRRAAGGRD